MINVRREEAGVPPLVLGTNQAAQIHAEAAQEGCFTGHWGLDGTTPGMRYSLAGGYQANAENATGLNYCIQVYENFTRISDVAAAVRSAAIGLIDSPSHAKTLTSSLYMKVNIGLAWDSYIVWLVQQFEGDYVRFQQLPELDGTLMRFAGQTINGASTDLESQGLKVDIYHHPLGPLTPGQVARAYCLDIGKLVGTLIPPAAPGNSYGALLPQSKSFARCASPYNVPTAVKAPGSYREAKQLHSLQRTFPLLSQWHLFEYVVANKWEVEPTSFNVSADIGEIIDGTGKGAYQFVFWGNVNGETHIIAETWLFHGVEVPSGYNSE